MVKKIKKEKIKKYVGGIILGSFVISGTALNIYDEKFDHTKDECLICKLWNTPIYIGEEVGTLGIDHQMREISYYYNSVGENVSVSYESLHQDYENIGITPLIQIEMFDKSFKDNARGNYELKKIDGKMYAVYKSPVGDAYQAIIIDHLDDENKIASEEVLKIGK